MARHLGSLAWEPLVSPQPAFSGCLDRHHSFFATDCNVQQQLPLVSSSAKRFGNLLEFRVAKALVFELLRRQQRLVPQSGCTPAHETVIHSAGTRLARTAEAIGMIVMGLNSKSSRSDLEAMLQVADVVSLHCSLTPKTHHLIG